MPGNRGRGTRYWREHTVPYVLRRDHGLCWICGQPGADSADHVIPHSRGGNDRPSNLRAIHHNTGCRANRYRGDRLTPAETLQRVTALGLAPDQTTDLIW